MSGRERIYNEEARRKASEQAKRQWQDPEYAARTVAAHAESFRQRWADPAKREKILTELAYARCSPSFRENNRTPERRKARSDLMRRLNADPAVKRRKSEALKEFWSSPDPARDEWLSRRNSKANDTRRGFTIPKEKRAEYQFLRRSKKFGAQEAGRILGLVK